MAQAVHEAMNASRREFNISLSRRGSFTVAIASAEWGETALRYDALWHSSACKPNKTSPIVHTRH